MSIHGLAAIAIRLTGIVIGLYAIKSGAASIFLAMQTAPDPMVWVALVPAAAMAAAAACMIVFPGLISGSLVPADHAIAQTQPATQIDFEGIACTLVGLYFLVQTALDATYLVTYWLASTQLTERWVWTANYLTVMATTVVEFIIAVWLLFGARGLMGLLRWARNFDTRSDDENR